MAAMNIDIGSKQTSNSILKIMFVNINGIREKLHETIQLAQDQLIDIIILNETKLIKKIPIKVKGYNVFR